MNTKTTKAIGSMTVREAAALSKEQGYETFSAWLADHPIPRPPRGYTLAHKSQHRWIGEEIVKSRWILLPVWDARKSPHHSFELWMADHKAPNYAVLTPAEALDLAADLIAAARAIAPQG